MPRPAGSRAAQQRHLAALEAKPKAKKKVMVELLQDHLALTKRLAETLSER